MNPPTISIQSIPEEGLSLDMALSHGWLRNILEGSSVAPAAGEGRASVRLDLHKLEVTLSGTADLSVVGECVACLEPVTLPVHAEFQLVLMPGARRARTRPHEEIELTADELDVDYYEDDSIDLAQWLRQEVLLETPLHPRHTGDCPHALVSPDSVTEAEEIAVEKPVDPRLLPLMKFAKKE